MANPNGPPDQYKWKKGQSGNPAGKPKLPEHLRDIQELTADEVNRTIARYTRMSPTDLQAVLDDPKAIVMDKIIAAGMMKAIKDGDYGRFSFLLDRTIGKTVDKSEVKVESSKDDDLDIVPRDILLKLASGGDPP
jgi:hypothetical protein